MMADDEEYWYQIIDGFLSEEEVQLILGLWPANGWKRARHRNSAKIYNTRPGDWSESFSDLYFSAASRIEEIIKRKNANAVFDKELHGAGIHEHGKGGFLNIHVDFNYIKEGLGIRSFNALLYLTKPEVGGSLELWYGDSTKPKTKMEVVTPEPGRLVLFEATESSWHGLPERIGGSVPRRSMAFYFYDPMVSVPAKERHSTKYSK